MVFSGSSMCAVCDFDPAGDERVVLIFGHCRGFFAGIGLTKSTLRRIALKIGLKPTESAILCAIQCCALV